MMMHQLHTIAQHSGTALTLGADGVAFSRPIWLYLLIPVGIVLVIIGRKSLSGMGTNLRRVALGLRLLVAGLIIAALAEPQWMRRSEAVSVTTIVDVSRSQPADIVARTREMMNKASVLARDGDLLGLVSAANEGRVQQIPRPVRIGGDAIDAPDVGATDATNLESGVRMALASISTSAANRLLLISDGNQTAGSLMEAAKAAKAAGVPIDVVPVRYMNEAEVLVDRLLAPSVSRQGENAKLRVVLSATKPSDGLLTVLLNGEAIDLNGDAPGVAKAVSLLAGTNVQEALVRLPRATGPARFEAVFEPVRSSDGKLRDTLVENNRAMAVTFVGGEGRALLLTRHPEQAAEIMRAMQESKIACEMREPSNAPQGLAELGSYECVILVNVSRDEFSQQQQEELRSYVHDLGGGLVMIGGDESFGAGGWIGSTLAEALPIKLDPPQKREMPRGALVLVMHSCEMPEGNYWGRRTGEAAIQALSAKDLIGIVEYSWQGGDNWIHPLAEVGDRSAALRSINSLTYGDAPSFDTMLSDAYNGLMKVNAGQRHVVVISDGDPQLLDGTLLPRFAAAKISISTVAVFPHSYGNASSDLQKMRRMAETTNGKYHEVTGSTGNLKSLPEIFIKEARTVKRSLIQESEPFSPTLVMQSEAMRGIGKIPPITGYVVAGDREGLAQVIMRGKENDPILAQWQYGLGRSVTFTSDATGKWARAWVNWAQYRAFWEQHVRWAMRPAGNPNVRVVTEDRGEKTAVIVEALDDKGEKLNFLRWQGRAVRPDMTSVPVELRQVGPGRYEALVETQNAGAYTINMSYQTGEGEQRGRAAVQAAITRPFADEFRALRDNAALLEQVAQDTGGMVLAPEDITVEGKNPWRREGLKAPISLQPVFLTAAMIAMGLLLTDVAVRRVRINPRAITGAFTSAFSRGKKTGAGEQIGSLRAAREKAKQMLDERSGLLKDPGGSPRDRAGPTTSSEALAKAASNYASAKFEASAEELARSKNASIVDAPGASDEARKAQIEQQKPKPGDEPAAGEGMSRLLKAKKRAQEEQND